MKKKIGITSHIIFSDCIEAYIYISQDPQQWVLPLLALLCNDIEIYDHFFIIQSDICKITFTNNDKLASLVLSYALRNPPPFSACWKSPFHGGKESTVRKPLWFWFRVFRSEPRFTYINDK